MSIETGPPQVHTRECQKCCCYDEVYLRWIKDGEKEREELRIAHGMKKDSLELEPFFLCRDIFLYPGFNTGELCPKCNKHPRTWCWLFPRSDSNCEPCSKFQNDKRKQSTIVLVKLL